MPEAKVALLEIQPRSVKLQKAAQPGFFEGSFSLALTNSRGVGFAARVEVRPEGDAKAEWISIPEDRKLFDFAADRTESIPIKLRVPESAAGKTFQLTVKVMDKANTDELYDTLGAEVVVPALDAPRPQPSAMPKWLIPVIVGGVLLLAGGGFAIYKVVSGSGAKAGVACGSDKDCPKGIACHPTKMQCLADKGDPCERDEECTTSHCGKEGTCAPIEIGKVCDPKEDLCGDKLECTDGKCLGQRGAACTKKSDCLSGNCDGQSKKCEALAAGEPCDPKQSFCADKLDCMKSGNGSANRCLAALNGECKRDADCSTGRCAAGKCAPTKMKAGEVCDKDCGAPTLACKAVGAARICKGEVGYSPCARPDDCVSGNCIGGACQYPAPGAACSPAAAASCPANQVCYATRTLLAGNTRIENVCRLRPGITCQPGRPRDCASEVCNANNRCAPDNGSCSIASDCPGGVTCKNNRCMFANGHKCSNSIVCLSEYCEGSKCMANPCGTSCGSSKQCVRVPISGGLCMPRPSIAYESSYRVSLGP